MANPATSPLHVHTLGLALLILGSPAAAGQGSGPRPTIRDVTQIAQPFSCADSIRDASTGMCVPADSTPTLGRLYPLGSLFNIDPGGDIEISAACTITKGGVPFLHNQGVLRNTALGLQSLALASITTGVSNTAIGYQTLFSNTSGHDNTANGDRVLLSNTTGLGNTGVGSRALFSNTTGSRNTASGYRALYSNTTGFSNTASGHQALFSNTTGRNNTASGYRALFANTEGSYNTANGWRALASNTEGDFNTATGFQALLSNTTGEDNTATGYRALFSNTTGLRNTAHGHQALASNTSGYNNTAVGNEALRRNIDGWFNTAIGINALYYVTGDFNIGIGGLSGMNLTTGSRNIAIGHTGSPSDSFTTRIGSTQERAFIAGIRGRTTGFADGINVLIDSSGQLGTISSSRRLKQDIGDMGDATTRLLDLRPVVFRYRQHVEDHGADAPFEFGLIAEEVAEVFPELVVCDEDGQPFTVKYHLLSSMLLNELQRSRADAARQAAQQTAQLEALGDRVQELERLVRAPSGRR